MIKHSDCGGRCQGKMIRQSRRSNRPEVQYICNVCDTPMNKVLMDRLILNERRRRNTHRATSE